MRNEDGRTLVWLAVGLLLLVLIVAAAFLSGFVRFSSGPFYGRGNGIRVSPSDLKTGPIDPNRGIPGVVELGMPVSEVRANLGSPLIKAGTVPGLSDPEDDPGDFYDKRYVWVTYASDGTVAQITWDPLALKKKYGVRQTIELRLGGRTCRFGPDDSQLDVIRMLAGGSTPAAIRVSGPSVVIVGTKTYLQFVYRSEHDNGRLRSVSIIH